MLNSIFNFMNQPMNGLLNQPMNGLLNQPMNGLLNQQPMNRQLNQPPKLELAMNNSKFKRISFSYSDGMFLDPQVSGFCETMDDILVEPISDDLETLHKETRESIECYLSIIFSEIHDTRHVTNIETMMKTGNNQWKTYFKVSNLKMPNLSLYQLDLSKHTYREYAESYTKLYYAKNANWIAHNNYPQLQSVLEFKVRDEIAFQVLDSMIVSLKQRKQTDLIHNLIILLDKYRKFYTDFSPETSNEFKSISFSYNDGMFLHPDVSGFAETLDDILADPDGPNYILGEWGKNSLRHCIGDYLLIIFSEVQDVSHITNIETLMKNNNDKWKTYFEDLGYPNASASLELDFSKHTCREYAESYTKLFYAIYAEDFANQTYPRLQSVLDFKVDKETANTIIDDVCTSLKQRKQTDLIHNLLILLERLRARYY
jgi:hypothetical protein